jgi:hypothetical protein
MMTVLLSGLVLIILLFIASFTLAVLGAGASGILLIYYFGLILQVALLVLCAYLIMIFSDPQRIQKGKEVLH